MHVDYSTYVASINCFNAQKSLTWPFLSIFVSIKDVNKGEVVSLCMLEPLMTL